MKKYCFESTKYKKLLTYIDKEHKNRKFHFPLIDHYIDVAETETLNMKSV